MGISDDPKDFNRKLLLFKDLETDSIVRLSLMPTHYLITEFSDKKIVTVEYSLIQYENIKVRRYPGLGDIDCYRVFNFKDEIKEMERLKKLHLLAIITMLMFIIMVFVTILLAPSPFL